MSLLTYPDIDLGYLTTSSSHTSVGEDTIKNSIRRILTTRKRTRVFNRSFGSRIEELLFDPISELTSMAIRSEVFLVLEMFEPRIVILYNRSSVTPDPENNMYIVNVVFRIKMTEQISEVTVYLSRDVAYG